MLAHLLRLFQLQDWQWQKRLETPPKLHCIHCPITCRLRYNLICLSCGQPWLEIQIQLCPAGFVKVRRQVWE